MSLITIMSSFKVRRWWSIRILYSIMFLTNFTFTSMFTNLYPYLKTLNEDVGDGFYSWAVAVYPLGISISSPFLGYWFNYCSTRQPLVFALSLLTLLDILYSYCSLFPPNVAIWLVLVLRLLMGVCSGSKSVIHAYITAATTVEERTGILGTLTSFIPLAYIIGPAVGLLFQPLGYPGYTVPYIRLPVSIYTGPILFSALTSILLLISLIWFKEFLITPRNISITTPSNESDPLISDRGEETPAISKPPYDRLAFISMIVASFVSHLFVATIDSLISPYSMDEFAWSKETAVFYNNIIFIACGVVAVISTRSINVFVKFIQERIIYLISLFILCFAIFVFIPWPWTEASLYLLHTPLNSSDNSSNLSTVGCDSMKHSWCLTNLKLRVFQIFLAPIFFCLSFPVTYLTVVTITSKIIGPHPPGLLMGFLGSGAGLGRFAGPILFVPLYSKFGPQITFVTMDLMVVALALLGLATFYRLVPYGKPKRCI